MNTLLILWQLICSLAVDTARPKNKNSIQELYVKARLYRSDDGQLFLFLSHKQDLQSYEECRDVFEDAYQTVFDHFQPLFSAKTQVQPMLVSLATMQDAEERGLICSRQAIEASPLDAFFAREFLQWDDKTAQAAAFFDSEPQSQWDILPTFSSMQPAFHNFAEGYRQMFNLRPSYHYGNIPSSDYYEDDTFFNDLLDFGTYAADPKVFVPFFPEELITHNETICQTGTYDSYIRAFLWETQCNRMESLSPFAHAASYGEFLQVDDRENGAGAFIDLDRSYLLSELESSCLASLLSRENPQDQETAMFREPLACQHWYRGTCQAINDVLQRDSFVGLSQEDNDFREAYLRCCFVRALADLSDPQAYARHFQFSEDFLQRISCSYTQEEYEAVLSQIHYTYSARQILEASYTFAQCLSESRQQWLNTNLDALTTTIIMLHRINVSSLMTGAVQKRQAFRRVKFQSSLAHMHAKHMLDFGYNFGVYRYYMRSVEPLTVHTLHLLPMTRDADHPYVIYDLKEFEFIFDLHGVHSTLRSAELEERERLLEISMGDLEPCDLYTFGKRLIYNCRSSLIQRQQPAYARSLIQRFGEAGRHMDASLALYACGFPDVPRGETLEDSLKNFNGCLHHDAYYVNFSQGVMSHKNISPELCVEQESIDLTEIQIGETSGEFAPHNDMQSDEDIEAAEDAVEEELSADQEDDESSYDPDEPFDYSQYPEPFGAPEDIEYDEDEYYDEDGIRCPDLDDFREDVVNDIDRLNWEGVLAECADEDFLLMEDSEPIPFEFALESEQIRLSIEPPAEEDLASIDDDAWAAEQAEAEYFALVERDEPKTLEAQKALNEQNNRKMQELLEQNHAPAPLVLAPSIQSVTVVKSQLETKPTPEEGLRRQAEPESQKKVADEKPPKTVQERLSKLQSMPGLHDHLRLGDKIGSLSVEERTNQLVWAIIREKNMALTPHTKHLAELLSRLIQLTQLSSAAGDPQSREAALAEIATIKAELQQTNFAIPEGLEAQAVVEQHQFVPSSENAVAAEELEPQEEIDISSDLAVLKDHPGSAASDAFAMTCNPSKLGVIAKSPCIPISTAEQMESANDFQDIALIDEEHRDPRLMSEQERKDIAAYQSSMQAPCQTAAELFGKVTNPDHILALAQSASSQNQLPQSLKNQEVSTPEVEAPVMTAQELHKAQAELREYGLQNFHALKDKSLQGPIAETLGEQLDDMGISGPNKQALVRTGLAMLTSSNLTFAEQITDKHRQDRVFNFDEPVFASQSQQAVQPMPAAACVDQHPQPLAASAPATPVAVAPVRKSEEQIIAETQANIVYRMEHPIYSHTGVTEQLNLIKSEVMYTAGERYSVQTKALSDSFQYLTVQDLQIRALTSALGYLLNSCPESMLDAPAVEQAVTVLEDLNKTNERLARTKTQEALHIILERARMTNDEREKFDETPQATVMEVFTKTAKTAERNFLRSAKSNRKAGRSYGNYFLRKSEKHFTMSPASVVDSLSDLAKNYNPEAYEGLEQLKLKKEYGCQKDVVPAGCILRRDIKEGLARGFTFVGASIADELQKDCYQVNCSFASDWFSYCHALSRENASTNPHLVFTQFSHALDCSYATSDAERLLSIPQQFASEKGQPYWSFEAEASSLFEDLAQSTICSLSLDKYAEHMSESVLAMKDISFCNQTSDIKSFGSFYRNYSQYRLLAALTLAENIEVPIYRDFSIHLPAEPCPVINGDRTPVMSQQFSIEDIERLHASEVLAIYEYHAPEQVREPVQLELVAEEPAEEQAELHFDLIEEHDDSECSQSKWSVQMEHSLSNDVSAHDGSDEVFLAAAHVDKAKAHPVLSLKQAILEQWTHKTEFIKLIERIKVAMDQEDPGSLGNFVEAQKAFSVGSEVENILSKKENRELFELPLRKCATFKLANFSSLKEKAQPEFIYKKLTHEAVALHRDAEQTKEQSLVAESPAPVKKEKQKQEQEELRLHPAAPPDSILGMAFMDCQKGKESPSEVFGAALQELDMTFAEHDHLYNDPASAFDAEHEKKALIAEENRRRKLKGLEPIDDIEPYAAEPEPVETRVHANMLCQAIPVTKVQPLPSPADSGHPSAKSNAVAQPCASLVGVEALQRRAEQKAAVEHPQPLESSSAAEFFRAAAMRDDGIIPQQLNPEDVPTNSSALYDGQSDVFFAGGRAYPAQNGNKPIEELSLPPEFRYFNKDQTFSNFVVSPKNQGAVAAAWQVANNLGNPVNNPFFLCGPTGTGKTHLLNAIINSAFQQNPDLNICTIQAQDLINLFVKTTKNVLSRNRFNGPQVYFKDMFSTCDILVVDNFQGMSKAKGTLKALDEIITRGITSCKCQIILVSQQETREMGLEEESKPVLSRIMSGLCSSVGQLDYSTSMHVLDRMCHDMHVPVLRGVKAFIARHFDGNGAAMLGVIKTLKCQTNSKARMLDYSESIELLQPFILSETKAVHERDILTVVAKVYGITIAEIRGKSRRRQISQARSMAMAIMRTQLPEKSLRDIAHTFHRDHTSVLAAIRRVTNESLIAGSDTALKLKECKEVLHIPF